MIDIKFLRENPEIVKENIKKKFQDEKLPLVDEVIALDAESRKQYPIAQVSVTLIQLCMKNLAKQAGAGYYTRS